MSLQCESMTEINLKKFLMWTIIVLPTNISISVDEIFLHSSKRAI